MAQGMLPWQPILGSKFIRRPGIVAMAFRNLFKYRHPDFKKFIHDDLATLFANLVNFRPVSP